MTKILIGVFQSSESVRRKFQRFLGLSTKYLENVFPLDCHKALEENIISPRQTEISRDLLEKCLSTVLVSKVNLPMDK